MLRGARIAVTGGAGFVGSHVAARLLRAGADVKIIDDLSTGSLSNLVDSYALGLTDSDMRICDGRGQDCADVIVKWRPDAVVHLAAQASLPAAVRSPIIDADINIRGTVNVLDACAKAGVGMFVYATSSAIYGQVPSESLPVTEQTPIAPISPYGLSKATALRYLKWYRQHRNLRYTALALGNVYGPRQFGQDCGVVSRMDNEIVRGSMPSITGDGQQTRDFVYVTDVAEAVAMTCAAGDVGLVNIASGTEATVYDVFNSVRSLTGARVSPRFIAASPGEACRMVMDISRARTVWAGCPQSRWTTASN
ncbi:NAD-dependent epimerase/dehydratase family protein [Polymorphospora rubra]|uniref:NAD-dependent epimerase/dehydratase family protein n=1 Tax=Polymorphospora rubra TaxID=338584 RepID=UPI0033FFD60F